MQQGFFYMHHPTDRIIHTTAFVKPVVEHWLEHLLLKRVDHEQLKVTSKPVRGFAHGMMGHRIDPSWWFPLNYFSFQPVTHDWYNKLHGMCYPICGMVHIKEPLLLIGKSSPCSGSSGFSLSLSEWSFTICLTPYNHKSKCIECVVK